MEGDVKHGQAAVLRGTVSIEQTTHGNSPRLQIQVSALFIVIIIIVLHDCLPAADRTDGTYDLLVFCISNF